MIYCGARRRVSRFRDIINLPPREPISHQGESFDSDIRFVMTLWGNLYESRLLEADRSRNYPSRLCQLSSSRKKFAIISVTKKTPQDLKIWCKTYWKRLKTFFFFKTRYIIPFIGNFLLREGHKIFLLYFIWSKNPIQFKIRWTNAQYKERTRVVYMVLYKSVIANRINDWL